MSTSETTSESTSITEDNRQAVDAGGIAVGADSVVTINQVPDELIEFGSDTIDAFKDALNQTQKNSRTESAQLGEQLIKIGIPAIALVFILGKMK